MVSFKAILIFFIAVHLLSSFFILFPRSSSDSKRGLKITSDLREFLEFSSESTNKARSKYKFIRPYIANKVLKELNVPTEINNHDIQIGRAYLGFKKDNNYCIRRQAYFVFFSESLFEKTNIVHAHPKNSYLGRVVSSFANDLHADHLQHMKVSEKGMQIYHMMPSASSFFTPEPLYSFYDINQQCSCLSQIYNQIPGSEALSKKDKTAQAIRTYMKKYEDRPQCLSYENLFPQTWFLSNADECKQFFEKLNSPEYDILKKERTIVYGKKIAGMIGGAGIQPLNQKEETSLRNQYKNGSLCGQVNTNNIMQRYIHNPLLLNGQKFEFRMLLLVASVNPLIVYYHDGFLRVSLNKSNTTVDQEKFKEAQQWTFEKLETYLLEEGLISDPNWLDNYLRPEFKKVLIHLVRLSSDQYVKHSSFYGLFGGIFTLDEDLKLWFIEANAGPEFDGYSKTISPDISQKIKDHFEIVFGLLRSRMKRVVNYVNSLIEDGSVQETGDDKVIVEDVEFHREKFKEITMNYFEKEFEASESNGFEKIIDENESDDAVYQGIIDKTCL